MCLNKTIMKKKTDEQKDTENKILNYKPYEIRHTLNKNERALAAQ